MERSNWALCINRWRACSQQSTYARPDLIEAKHLNDNDFVVSYGIIIPCVLSKALNFSSRTLRTIAPWLTQRHDPVGFSSCCTLRMSRSFSINAPRHPRLSYNELFRLEIESTLVGQMIVRYYLRQPSSTSKGEDEMQSVSGSEVVFGGGLVVGPKRGVY
jgi:hypothetical protein